ncbi:cGMP-dependent protein kinase, isozyme 1-like [Argiope bruennichi]|nr:cGMP-dependent protein kinase, isozyme 1-like [Argiope bruennichi]
MGSGSSSGFCHSGTKQESDADSFEMDLRVRELEERASNLESLLREAEAQVAQMKKEVDARDKKIDSLLREIHKLKSVLEITSNNAANANHANHVSNNVGPTDITGPLVPPTTKKQGVSGESATHPSSKGGSDYKLERHEKDFRWKQLIKDAILGNDFLQHLVTSCQVKEIVDCMYSKKVPAGSLVIREGEPGRHLYVSAEGELEVRKGETVLGIMGPGKAFGELAILYNCTRTATVKAVSDALLWVLDRRAFQTIMVVTGIQRQEENINFLKSVPLLKNLSNELLSKMADVLEVDFYPAAEYIIRQGETGDTFFIISNGQVRVTQKVVTDDGLFTEEEIRCLGRGEYFGEQALLREDKRTANVIAMEPGVECLTLNRESFNQLIGDLQELQTKTYGDEDRMRRISNMSAPSLSLEEEYKHIQLDDLDVLATLGVGGFGRVQLVQYIYDRQKTFALKILKKVHIVETQQQQHALSERAIMMSCKHPFICRMYKTFRDDKYVFMLMEACLGGEVWSILRDKGNFDDCTTRFITACVLEALEYLHKRNIIYRDLKPENLLLDSQGYVKLVDFGFSKVLPDGRKTWTFCGTPEYVAPEIILNRGHDKAVDFWAIGILMYELLTGTPPFCAFDPMKTYKIILKGLDALGFPNYITKNAISLMRRLCRDNPAERLGYQKGGITDIKKHKWFQGFDWDGLRNRSLTPPIVPKVKDPTDASNFDVYPIMIEDSPPDFSGWDKDFDCSTNR